jgi:RHS repeat-associated protein
VEAVSRGAGSTTSGGGSAGTVEGDYRGDAFGVALAASADTIPTSGNLPDSPLGYLGGLGYWNEPELGLQYVRARWLDNTNGQWLSTDPVEGEPRYAYADNNPQAFTDASGRFGEPPPWLLNLPPSDFKEFLLTGYYLPDATASVFQGYATAIKKEGFRGFLNAVLKPALERIRTFEATGEALWRTTVGEAEYRYGRFLKDEPQLAQAAIALTSIAHNASAAKSLEFLRKTPLEAFAPPPLTSKRAVSYWGGFLWEVGAGLASILRAGIDVVELAAFLFESPSIWQNLFTVAKELFNETIQFTLKKVSGGKRLSFYERGKFIGGLLGMVVEVVEMLVGVPKVLSKLTVFSKNAQQSLKNLTETLGSSPERTDKVRQTLARVRQRVQSNVFGTGGVGNLIPVLANGGKLPNGKDPWDDAAEKARRWIEEKKTKLANQMRGTGGGKTKEQLPERLLTSDGQPVPFGFRSDQDYLDVLKELFDGLPDDVYAILWQGSSVTGRKYTTGEIFDVGRISDYDIALIAPSLYQQAFNSPLGRTFFKDNRIGPVKVNGELSRLLGLDELQRRLSAKVGREVNFNLYADYQTAERVGHGGFPSFRSMFE